MRSLWCSILITTLLAGCSFGDKEKQDVTQPEVVPSATFITYELRDINDKKGPCATDSSSQPCLNVDINYPIITKGGSQQVLDSVNKGIKEDIFSYAFIKETPKSFESLIDEISDEYEAILKEFPDYTNPWSLEISSDIIFQAPKFISVATTIFSYTGGAHPNSYLVYKSYDLQTGKAIALGDILRADFEQDLYRSAEIEFRMNNKIPPSQDLSESGFFFEDEEFKLNDNFAIIDKSLIFYFNPYEIASYSRGPSELELKLTDYADMIKSGSVIDDF